MKQIAAVFMLTLGAMAAKVNNPEKPFISGEIKSHETFQYGRFVTKMQGCDRKGTLASFLTMW